MSEALSEQQRRQHHRNHRLRHEHHRRHLDRRTGLQSAHLAEDPHPRGGRRRKTPQGGREQVMGGEIIRGQLRRHPAPAKGQSGPDHRDLRPGVAKHPQQIGDQARDTEAHQHERDRELLRGVGGAARRCEDPRPDHPDHDGAHRVVLISACMLTQHPLGEEHQHKQARRQGRLDHHEGRQQQGDDLQRPAEDRQARPQQPAGTSDQPPDERQAQMLLVGRLLGVHRL